MSAGNAFPCVGVAGGGGDSGKNRLLSALAAGCSELEFSWRRPPASVDAALTSQLQEDTVQEMRRRMAAMPERPRPTQATLEAQAQDGTASRSFAGDQGVTFMHGCSTSTGKSSPSNAAPVLDTEQGQGGGASEGKRDEFLSKLAQGLRDAEVAFARRPSSSGRPASGGPLEEAHDQEAGAAEVGGQVPNAASKVGIDLGPGFFAEIQALQDRLAQRRGTKEEPGGSNPATPSHGVESAYLAAAPPKPQNLSPAETARGLQTPSLSTPRSRTPALGTCQTTPRGIIGRDTSTPPLFPSEQRRPRAGDVDSKTSSPTVNRGRSGGREQVKGNGSSFWSDEELLQTSSNDELLRWAEEVLKMAQKADVPASTETSLPAASPLEVQPGVATGRPTVPLAPAPAERPTASMASAPSPRPPSAPKVPRPPPSCSAAARERRRRAEDFQGVMRRLTAESENECDRLAFEEAARLRDFQEQQKEEWRDRINSAAEEMRNNFARGCSFEAPVAGAGKPRPMGAGAFGGTSRGGSVPQPPTARPKLVSPRRAAAVRATTPDSSDVRWARFEERLDEERLPIHFEDIPWPGGSSSIIGVMPGDSSATVKQKLAGALRRWHPDKWRRILDRVPEAEQARVMERVKNVAQRLLDEKAKLTVPSGAGR